MTHPQHDANLAATTRELDEAMRASEGTPLWPGAPGPDFPPPAIGEPCVVCHAPIREDSVDIGGDGSPLTWNGTCCPECTNGGDAIRAAIRYLEHGAKREQGPVRLALQSYARDLRRGDHMRGTLTQRS